MRKDSDFRKFVNEKYMEHKDECKWYRIPCKFQTLEAYAYKNRWYLKKLYKEKYLWSYISTKQQDYLDLNQKN